MKHSVLLVDWLCKVDVDTFNFLFATILVMPTGQLRLLIVIFVLSLGCNLQLVASTPSTEIVDEVNNCSIPIYRSVSQCFHLPVHFSVTWHRYGY